MTTAADGTKAPFNPTEVVIINEAYRRALVMLGQDSAHGDKRADLARIVVELARSGELDIDRLCRRAATATRKAHAADRLIPC